jgi:transposase InsO family protein
MNETDWIFERWKLWEQMQKHPDWGVSKLTKVCGHSSSWVSKWYRRLKEEQEAKLHLFMSRSCAPKKPKRYLTEEVRQRILEIRDHPPENLRRTPGPRTIVYYLRRDTSLSGFYIPTSTRTIWLVLDDTGRIERPQPRKIQEEERPEPLTHWQIDFADASLAKDPDPEGKKQHYVEILNVVDKGTSIALYCAPRIDYHAATVIEEMAELFKKRGLPEVITFDRDPRFISGWQMKEFPSAFLKFLWCLDVRSNICPPRRPDRNAFVERFNKNLKYECLYCERPSTIETVSQAVANYQHHYNVERPNQALSCEDQPPYFAFPRLPTLPELPEQVDPTAWLKRIDRQLYPRQVNANGSIKIDKYRYYITKDLKKQRVILQVLAPERQFKVYHGRQHIKSIPIKGVTDSPLIDFDEFVVDMAQQALAEWRQYRRRR